MVTLLTHAGIIGPEEVDLILDDLRAGNGSVEEIILRRGYIEKNDLPSLQYATSVIEKSMNR